MKLPTGLLDKKISHYILFIKFYNFKVSVTTDILWSFEQKYIFDSLKAQNFLSALVKLYIYTGEILYFLVKFYIFLMKIVLRSIGSQVDFFKYKPFL